MKYMLGAFRLGNNIEFPIVTFMRARKDVDGSFVMENGRRIYDEIEFDLRGKAFKDLPPELQSDFESYSFSIVKQLDCTNEEVGYHIRRYNKQSNMNGSEKTITYLDTIAETIKEISAHKFFKDNCTKISQNEKIKGAVNKIVIETLMILNYFEDWTKDNKKQGLYLEEKATEDDFNGLKNILDRLANTITEENESLFTSKNTFIWIKMFDYFTKNFNLPDEKFSEFLSAFINELREKDGKLVTPMKIYGEETDHCTYKALDESKSTKDKGVVNNKLHILETLMNEYFSNESTTDSVENNEVESKVDEIQTEEFEKKVEETIDDTEMETLDFVRKYVDPEITEEDVDGYWNYINGLVKTRIIKGNSEMLLPENENSMMAMLAWSEKEDKNIATWLQRFSVSHKTMPDMSQRERFEYMKKNCQKFEALQVRMKSA